MTSGIDVSQWQGKIDWAKVKKAGVQFALIRAGYGDTLSYPAQIDRYYEYNYNECKKNGIPVGVYFYSYAMNAAEAKREAQCCLALLKGKKFEFPIYYDVEEYSLFKSGKTNEVIKAFFDVLEKAGYWVGLYIYRSALTAYVSSDIRDKKALAIAEYGSKLNYSGQYGVWQNSSTAYVDGISGRVDHDYCYVDYPKLIKEKGKNGFEPTEYRVSAVHGCYTYDGKEHPALNGAYKAGSQWTIEKTISYAGATWGKVKGADKWVNMADVKRI